MSKSKKIITVLAILVALMPFFGFPGSWEDGFIFLAGLAIAALAFFDGRPVSQSLFSRNSRVSTDSFSESRPREVSSSENSAG